MPNLTYGSKTDVGRVRKSNQDSFVIVDAGAMGGRADGLFVVADGMGGRAGGDVASRLAAEAVPAVVREVLDDGGSLADAVREALIDANETVYREARARPELRGMATTCVVAIVRGDTAVVGNVGDSRIYLLRAGQIRALTHDHSLVQEYVGRGEMSREEARGSRFRNVITRGIGLTSSVTPDVDTVRIEQGDTLLLCTDGLTGMLEDEQIARILAAEPGAQQAADRLVAAANQHGGRDNTTVVVARYGTFTPIEMPDDDTVFLDAEQAEPASAEPRRRHKSSPANPVLLVLLLAALVAVVALGKELYRLSAAWPFVERRPAAPNLVAPTSAPPPDLAHLTWDGPALFSAKAVRPAPIWVDSRGSVYAVSVGGRLLRFGPDGRAAAAYPSTVAPAPVSAGNYTAVDPHGYVYVASRRDHSIARYDAQGTRAGIVQQGLTAPEGIAVDTQCNIYVVDGGRIRLLRARTTPAPVGGADPVERGDGAR